MSFATSKELNSMFDVNVAGTASVMKHMVPLVLDSNEKKASRWIDLDGRKGTLGREIDVDRISIRVVD